MAMVEMSTPKSISIRCYVELSAECKRTRLGKVQSWNFIRTVVQKSFLAVGKKARKINWFPTGYTEKCGCTRTGSEYYHGMDNIGKYQSNLEATCGVNIHGSNIKSNIVGRPGKR